MSKYKFFREGTNLCAKCKINKTIFMYKTEKESVVCPECAIREMEKAFIAMDLMDDTEVSEVLWKDEAP
jgi:hypothetical protein